MSPEILVFILESPIIVSVSVVEFAVVEPLSEVIVMKAFHPPPPPPAPISIIDSVPLFLLRNSLPSNVLMASSPKANCAVVGTALATADLFNLTIFAMWLPLLAYISRACGIRIDRRRLYPSS